MSDRIPASLNWLVKRRRTVAGQLAQAEKRRRNLITEHEQALRSALAQSDLEIRALQIDLGALDQTIRLHEIAVDPSKLGATRVQSSPRRSSHGAMTKAIYEALSKARPKALTTDAIAAFVCVKCELHPSQDEYEGIRLSVRHRLKNLVRLGKVIRLHSSLSNTGGLWCDPRTKEELSLLAMEGRAEHPSRPLEKVPRAGLRELLTRQHMLAK